MLQNYRNKIDDKRAEVRVREKSEKVLKSKLKHLEEESKSLEEARDIFKKAALLTQNYLASHLSTIVTKALRATFFEKDMHFKVEFVERRNVTECDMWFEENGHSYSLLESRGYGMTDIASFALRVAYVLLHSSENMLVIDEPFRNLSEDKHEAASQMIKELSKELDMQFIISTHVAMLREYADKSFQILQKEGVSKSY